MASKREAPPATEAEPQRPRDNREVDDALTAFWRELQGVKKPEGLADGWNWTITLKSSLLGKIAYGNVLFVRRVYVRLWDAFEASNRTGDGITGVPGTGKSFFLLYALWRVAGKGSSAVFQDTDGQRTFFDAGTGNAYVGSDFRRELGNEANFYLIDGARETSLPVLANARSFLATSPNKSVYSRFVKDHKIAVGLIVVPPWELNELTTLAVERGLFGSDERAARVGEFYGVLGGVPRLLLSAYDSHTLRPEEVWEWHYLRQFQLCLDECDAEVCLATAQSGSGVEAHVSHMIFLMWPLDDDPRRFFLKFASDVTSSLFLHRARLVGEERLRAFLTASHAIGGAFAALRGVVFEGYAMAVLSRGGHFKCWQLLADGMEVRDDLVVPEMVEVPFVSVEDVEAARRDALWVPESSTFPAVDCFSDERHVYQMTVDRSGHGLQRRGLEKLRTLYRSQLDVYFVVPRADYLRGFGKLQKQKNADKSDTAPTALIDIRQFVIVVPVDR